MKLAPLPADAQAGGLIVESSFTNLADVAAAVTRTRLPVHWLLSQEFDSLSKIAEVGMPVLIAHGRDDRFIPDLFAHQGDGERSLRLRQRLTINHHLRTKIQQTVQTYLRRRTAANLHLHLWP